jgi:hypothetical protein
MTAHELGKVKFSDLKKYSLNTIGLTQFGLSNSFSVKVELGDVVGCYG